MLPGPGRGEDGRPPASVYSQAARAAAKNVATAAKAAGVAEAIPAGAGADAAAQAERIVASSLATISRAESVSIRLRQRVRIGDRVLVGAGRYLQAGQGEEQRFRFEATLTCESRAFGIEPESFEVTEVSDGLFCWLHQRNGPDPSLLYRIDIQRVRGRLTELGLADPNDTAPYLGGLQRTLWWNRQWFRFAGAVPGEIDGLPVWIVEGRWPPETLVSMLPQLADAAKRPGGVQPEDLPDGVPWMVRLAVGRSDLLPRRLEYLAIPGERPVAAGPPEVIMAIEFLEIEVDAPVDATAFYYQPATEELIDMTGTLVKTLQAMRP
ncbi:MAG: hypothetical protein ACKO1M_11485 [Planctomycetota bacterium]